MQDFESWGGSEPLLRVGMRDIWTRVGTETAHPDNAHLHACDGVVVVADCAMRACRHIPKDNLPILMASDERIPALKDVMHDMSECSPL